MDPILQTKAIRKDIDNVGRLLAAQKFAEAVIYLSQQAEHVEVILGYLEAFEERYPEYYNAFVNMMSS